MYKNLSINDIQELSLEFDNLLSKVSYNDLQVMIKHIVLCNDSLLIDDIKLKLARKLYNMLSKEYTIVNISDDIETNRVYGIKYLIDCEYPKLYVA